MKKNFLRLKDVFLAKHWWLVLFTLNFNIFSQTSPPESISYQGVARDASGNILSNQPIGIQFLIHQGSPSGTVVFYETHSTSTNAVGIFTLAIGSVNTSTFQSIPWNNGPYYLEVLMDPTGGTNYISIGTQQLLSVPYALYAKNSYSAAASYTSAYALGSYTTLNAPPISITTNTSATSTTLNFAQGSNTTAVNIDFPLTSITMTATGIASVTPNTGNNFTVSVDSPTFTSTDGITNITGTYPNFSVTTNLPPPPTPTITGTGIATVTPTTGNNFTVNVPTPTITATSNTNTGVATLTISQGSASDTAIINMPVAPTPTITGTGIATVTPNTGNNFTVNVPTQTLSITGSPTSYTLSSNLGGSVPLPSPTLSINSPHTVAPLSGYAHTINIKPPDLITPSPNNIASVTSNTSTLQYSITVPSPTLSISTATTGVSTLTLTQGLATSTVSIPSPTNYAWGLKGNTASAADFLGTTNNADLIFKTNNTENMRITSGGNVGIGMTIPSAKLHINSSLTTPALQIDNSNGYGIYIQNSGTSGSAVYAWNSNLSNNNPAIYSYVPGGGGSAVHAQTNGTGAAVRAIAGTTSASNLALHIDNGHIKSTMSATPTITIGMVGGGFAIPTVSLETGSNDVRGTVSMTTSVSSFALGNICEVQVNFAKPYNSVPYVVVCPAGSLGTDMQGLSFTVRAVTSSFFRIAIYKSDNMTSPTSIPPNSTFSFNYFVIE